jgi:hypothetical protein
MRSAAAVALVGRESRAAAIKEQEDVAVPGEDRTERGGLLRFHRRAAAVREKDGRKRPHAPRPPEQAVQGGAAVADGDGLGV